MTDYICLQCGDMLFTASDLMNHRRQMHPEYKSEVVNYLPAEMPKVEAIKHDSGKPDFSMVSYELMEAVSKVRMFGATKYAKNNWKKGFKVTRSLAAALRHIFLFLRGETNDSESGLSHLAHAVCCLEHAIYDMTNHPENDDREAK